jgi:hypothetical protein
MPRQARLGPPGTPHHVMIRKIEGAKIFLDDQDGESPVTEIDSFQQRAHPHLSNLYI